METWRTTLSVFCQKLLLAALNNLQITRERWTSVSCFPWWHLDPGQHPSSHTWYRKSTKYTFFFFAGRDLSYGLLSSLYRTLESSVFHGHCWVSFHCERYQSPASTSEWKPGHQKLPSGAGVFSCQGQREEKFPICVFVLMLSEKVSGAVTKYL